jgi:hypothetical protein
MEARIIAVRNVTLIGGEDDGSLSCNTKKVLVRFLKWADFFPDSHEWLTPQS